MNAPKTPAPTFVMRDLPKVIANLTNEKHTICCMTREMVYKLFEGEKKKKTPPLLPRILEDSRVPTNQNGITAILLVVDEVHQIYKYKHFCEAVNEMRDSWSDIKWAVMGISSTTNLDKPSAVENAKLLFGYEKLPELAKFAEGDFASLTAKMYALPPKPTAADFVTINLASPVGDKEFREELKEVGKRLVNLMLASTEDKKKAHAALRDELSFLMAMQLHGMDGGVFLDTLCKTRDGPRLVKQGSSTPLDDPKESVLVCCKHDTAARKLMIWLKELNEKGGSSHPLQIVDLGVEIPAENPNLLRLACEEMSKSFNAQTDTTLGFACFRQHDAHDDFSKLGSAAVAVGFDWDEGELNQWGARNSRPFTKMVNGEVMPMKYEAYLFDSTFAKQVNAIDDSKLSQHIKISDYPTVEKALDSLETDCKLSVVEMKSFKTPVKKLLYADTILQTNTKLVMTYIDALNSKYKTDEDEMEESGDEEEGDEDEESDADEEDASDADDGEEEQEDSDSD
uniref:Uncharacterized protein n=1 Tax=Haptolina brevifila TaxID=156173 RepID=A0A7S2IKN3_9EUKA